MLVNVYTRHSPECAHRTDRNWKRCNCPKWLYWTVDHKKHRESAGTRTWSKAEQKARELEQRHELAVNGVAQVKQRETPTTEDAVAAFLADKESQKLRKDTLSKLTTIFQKQMQAWCLEHGVRFIDDFDLPHLQAWRNTWTDGDLTARKKQERVRGFFAFCQRNGWIKDNPALGLSKIKVTQKPTGYFTREEYQKVLDALPKYGKTESQRTRLRALIQLMRWSGLAIRDAVTLERERLHDDDNLQLYRAKTGVPVFVSLPHDVAEELRHIPDGPAPNPRYFFWSGSGLPKSAVADWQRAMRRLFTLADIKLPDCKPKRLHPHMLRDTFAVEYLLAGVPIDQVALMLGHSSVKTTEKHYAPFVLARQEQLIATVKAARERMSEAAIAGA
jgi:integrase